MFGEMSVLLDVPHTATVRALSPVTARVAEDGVAFMKRHPEIAFFLARLLAQRLNAATTYLVDLKQQFEGHGDHLGMVGEVLDALIHNQQDDFTPGSDREPDPRM
jgi:CRP-like cAMP-binding protein